MVEGRRPVIADIKEKSINDGLMLVDQSVPISQGGYMGLEVMQVYTWLVSSALYGGGGREIRLVHPQMGHTY